MLVSACIFVGPQNSDGQVGKRIEKRRDHMTLGLTLAGKGRNVRRILLKGHWPKLLLTSPHHHQLTSWFFHFSVLISRGSARFQAIGTALTADLRTQSHGPLVMGRRQPTGACRNTTIPLRSVTSNPGRCSG